jgi:hypothetical protein
MQILQRENWVGEPAFLGNAWAMTKRERTATCALYSHQFGWELRLSVCCGRRFVAGWTTCSAYKKNGGPH